MKQIWKCDECETERQWGFERLVEAALLDPLLECGPCHTQMRHTFVRLEPVSQGAK